MMKIGINGFGRIGRLALRRLLKRHPDLEVVAINNPGSVENNAYLFQHDSNYGDYPGKAEAKGDILRVDGRDIQSLAYLNPLEIPWKDLGVGLVIEATGIFRDADKAAAHLEGGVRRVLVTAPSKGAPATVVMGVNEETYDPGDHRVISAASCTTNCLALVADVLETSFGIEHGVMTTIHSYTNDQRILDKSHKKLRRSRAAAANIIPTTTGASKALGVVIPALQGKFVGMSYRVPTLTVSVLDVGVVLSRPAEADEINDAFQKAARGRMEGYLHVTFAPLVSTDFRGSPYSATVDGLSTVVVPESSMARVVAWYDNEWGYACRVADLARYIIEHEPDVPPPLSRWRVSNEAIERSLVMAAFGP